MVYWNVELCLHAICNLLDTIYLLLAYLFSLWLQLKVKNIFPTCHKNVRWPMCKLWFNKYPLMSWKLWANMTRHMLAIHSLRNHCYKLYFLFVCFILSSTLMPQQYLFASGPLEWMTLLLMMGQLTKKNVWPVCRSTDSLWAKGEQW